MGSEFEKKRIFEICSGLSISNPIQPFRCFVFFFYFMEFRMKRIIKSHKMNKFQLLFSTFRFPGGFEVYNSEKLIFILWAWGFIFILFWYWLGVIDHLCFEKFDFKSFEIEYWFWIYKYLISFLIWFAFLHKYFVYEQSAGLEFQ